MVFNQERATAMGIINGGSAVGAVIAPPLIALILFFANWRWIFVATGLLGIAWTIWWRHSYFPRGPPAAHQQEERKKLAQPLHHPGSARISAWIDLLKFRQTWGIVLARRL